MEIIQPIFLASGMFEPAAMVDILITTPSISVALPVRHIGGKAGQRKAQF